MNLAKALIFTAIFIGAITAGKPAADEWHIETVDAAGYVGWTNSIALDSSDNPCISYYDASNEVLKYAYFDGSTWSIEIVDTNGAGTWSSIALDSNGNPHISYFDTYNKDLKYARWTGSAWDIKTVNTVGTVGYYTSLALDSNDTPHISFYALSYQDLKYAYHTGGPTWSTWFVDTDGTVGYHTSIALDSNDNPHISYWDYSNQDLKYAYFDGSTWSVEVVDIIGSMGGYEDAQTSIALDSNDNPHISYFDRSDNDLKYAYSGGPTWYVETVDATGNMGLHSSIALDSNDNPHISYYGHYPGYNETCYLKYTYYDGSTWSFKFCDTIGGNVYYSPNTSIALDSSDNPHISYLESGNNDLKYAWYGPAIGPSLGSFSATPKSDNAIVLTWSVETTEEERIVGFNLERRDTSDSRSIGYGVGQEEIEFDDWTRVNTELISGNNLREYTDIDVEPGAIYEYKLEAVLADRTKTLGTVTATTENEYPVSEELTPFAIPRPNQSTE